MPHAASRLLPAADATARLGVSRQTLYSYVSRGLIRAAPAPDDPRRSLYDASDVARLVERRARRARRDVAASTTDWGEPILRSSLTHIGDGRYSYRGQDAVDLSQTANLEDVAALLWADPVLPGIVSSAVPNAASPLERCLRMLASRLDADDAADLLVLVSEAFAGSGSEHQQHAHHRFARAWGLDDAGADIIRRALVLCADHELNASAYTARVVASTGASLAACVLAGLAALSGRRHGGMTTRVRLLFDDPAVLSDPDRHLAACLARDGEIPGFGHRLYPDGDPRAAALLGLVDLPMTLHRAIQTATALTGLGPTLDVGLAALELCLPLPTDGGFAVFATGRTVGWMAHALEQRLDGRLIRPRAYGTHAP